MHELKVKHLMSTRLVTLSPERSVPLARELMELRRIRHLPVVDDRRLVGLITYRDLLEAQRQRVSHLMQRSHDHDIDLAIPVSRVMRRDVWTVGPETPALEAAQIMSDHDFGCLPVIADAKLVGIVTEADFLEMAIRQLERQRQAISRPRLLDRHTTSPRCVRTVLAVDDLPGAQRFYSEVFRWPIRQRTTISIAFELPDGSTLSICERESYARTSGASPTPVGSNTVSGTQLYLHCDDLHGVISRLETEQARCLVPLATGSSGDESAVFADPAGNVLIVARPLAPADTTKTSPQAIRGSD